IPGARVNIQDEKDGNTQVIRLLEKGAEALYFEIYSKVNPGVLCENIHLDYIFSIFQIPDMGQAQHYAEYLEKTYDKAGIKAFVVSGEEVVFPQKTLYLPVDI